MPKKNGKARKIGRPTKYTPEIANTICYLISGGLSLRNVCKDKEIQTLIGSNVSIAPSTIVGWYVENREGFSELYRRAKESQAELDTDELRHIALGATIRDAHARRVKIDTLKWLAQVRLPHKYGDRRTVQVEGHVTHSHVLIPSLQGLMLPYQADVVDVEALPEPDTDTSSSDT